MCIIVNNSKKDLQYWSQNVKRDDVVSDDDDEEEENDNIDDFINQNFSKLKLHENWSKTVKWNIYTLSKGLNDSSK